MKASIKLIAAALALILVLPLAACGKKETAVPNAKTASYEEIVSYFKEKGLIAEDAKPIDINTTAGYVTDNTNGEMPFVDIATKAEDFDGLWLFWWDVDNLGETAEVYENMAYHPDLILIQGGAALMEIKGFKGVCAIGYAEDFAKGDEAMAAFEAMPAE
ncbi:MAG: hypothetical protein IJL08_07365 [Oscillospiraceae bacterium]|nr:hypothetical protein [Oscillospiraceae bacterium]